MEDIRHPEDYCHKCGKDNTSWFADNDLFNLVNGSGNGIMCPNCFINMAEQKGINIIFKAQLTNP